MRRLYLHSEVFSPTGSLAAEGFMNVLGRPDQDVLTTLVREVVQNSWDARKGTNRVHFKVKGWKLDKGQQDFLNKKVFDDEPVESSFKERLNADGGINVLAICDKGTTGLGGPTRADKAEISGEPRDFVDFFRNIGHPPDKEHGGGTYGYGKAILYIASLVNTICAYTRCSNGGKLETRFIASGFTKPYINEKLRYTGRHWWGRKQGGIAEPALNGEADEIAKELGIIDLLDGKRGTVIVVFKPEFGGRESLEALKWMAEAVLWYSWPKMLAFGNKLAPMSFHLEWEGKRISLPHPSKYHPLSGFVDAMQQIRDDQSSAIPELSKTAPIECGSPKKHLGMLSLHKFPTKQRSQREDGSESVYEIKGLSRHVALMRAPELVVKYLEVSRLGSESWEYAGVFLADTELDRAFAESEPPTHDDWRPGFLSGHKKTFINVAVRRIREIAQEFIEPPRPMVDSNERIPLGLIADALGDLLGGAEPPSGGDSGNGDEEDNGSNGKPKRKRRKKAKVVISGDPQLVLFGRGRALEVPFEIEHLKDTEGTRISIRASVILDSNQTETDAPAESEEPKVLALIDPVGEEIALKDSFLIPAIEGALWKVLVSVPDDAEVQVVINPIEPGIAEAGK